LNVTHVHCVDTREQTVCIDDVDHKETARSTYIIKRISRLYAQKLTQAVFMRSDKLAIHV